MILPSVIKDRCYGIEFFGVFQFYTVPDPINVVVITPYYTTLLELRTKEGGLKKQWFYNQDADNPIETIDIEISEKGFGVCKAVFSDLMFPIDASDIVRLLFGGNPVYEGIVDNDVDVSNPIMVASPFWKRLDECTFTATYGAGTGIKEIMEDLITALQSQTGIIWNTAKVNVGDAPPVLTVVYADSLARDTIDSLVEMAGASYYWGVDSDREFFVKNYVETGDPVHKFYSMDEAEFEKVNIQEDYSKVEMTEAVVYKKVDGGGEAVLVGRVGNAGNITYPELDIVKKIRPKVGKITACEYLQDATALLWAYEYLKKQSRDIETVKIDNIDIEKYSPVVGDRILAEDDFKKAMYVAIDCDSTTGWTNVSVVSAQGKDEEDAIKLFLDGSNNSYYDFGRAIQYYKQEKIGFYIRGALNTVIEVACSSSLTPSADEWIKFAISDDSLLSYKDFDFQDEFQYIHFKYVSGDIYIDNIQVFCETKRQITTTVKNIKMKWDTNGVRCDLSCGNIKNPETDSFNKLNRKIRILEAINNI